MREQDPVVSGDKRRAPCVLGLAKVLRRFSEARAGAGQVQYDGLRHPQMVERERERLRVTDGTSQRDAFRSKRGNFVDRGLERCARHCFS